ncbi:MAG: VOC family protein [Bacteroidales bacterium]|nr:VOC family protein [Bacteroidales bacterium]
MIIDHICYAVKNLSESIQYWQEVFGYRPMTNPVVNTRQKVKVQFLQKADSLAVKLIEPLDGNISLQNFVDQGGGGFHHVCFKCDDLDQQVAELKHKKVRMLAPVQPGEAFDNNNIAFFLAKNRITFEVIDTDKRANLID